MEHTVVYCALCKDYVYNKGIDDIIASEVGGHKRRKTFETKHSVVWRNALSVPVSNVEGLLGVRGLYNLGNTCFMNAVLQTFLHNPLLRSYFLSDVHSRSRCSFSAASPGTKLKRRVCLGCDLSELYTEMYSGKRMPFVPSRLLYSLWSFNQHLAGYEQQDAHELFISMLDGIHASCPDPRTAGCTCVVHTVFGGKLRSELTCKSCNQTSTAYDPFIDISLDFGRMANTTPKLKPSASPGMAALGIAESCTLRGCLQSFVFPERLPPASKFKCSKCSASGNITKRFTLHALPLVLCFHLKRFRQGNAVLRTKSLKIDTLVEFPIDLDMTPYLHRTAITKKGKDVYCLFAVIVHLGSMASGHYIAYLRAGQLWFKCDDKVITGVTEKEVRGSQGYLLFYNRRSEKGDNISSFDADKPLPFR